MARRALTFDLELQEAKEESAASSPGQGQGGVSDDYVYYVMTKTPNVCDPRAM